MIIDCHGHYTTAPPGLQAFREAQLASIDAPSKQPVGLDVSDDQIRESIAHNQLRLMDERGVDVTFFSPKASGMAHHVVDLDVAKQWARTSNDLIARVVDLFPDRFVGVCQLPQTPREPITTVLDELERCVTELGFVGCNLNPDPSGGNWATHPLTDQSWYPLYEKLVELDVPAMIHVSQACNPNVHTTGSHYLNADTAVFMQLVQGDLFSRFPTLRFVIPHGGGAVPYHWGRFRGLAARLGKPPLEEHVMRNVSLDTCVYHQPGIDLLFRVIGIDSILFASEMIGAVPGVDPDTGRAFEDTKHYVDQLDLSDDERAAVFERNARRVYPRIEGKLK